MENSNVNGTNPQGGDLSNFKEAFSNYQKNQVRGRRKSKEEILAKYFVPRKTKEVFRILPYKTKFFYVEAFFHVVSTNIAGGKKKHGTVIYCPAHNDPKVKKLDSSGNPVLDGNGNPIMIPAPCPLCDKAKKILATQDPSLKNIKKDDLTEAQKKIWDKNRDIFIEAGKWDAKKFYIIRGIDKGAEKDGVKFWRFKHNFKNQGTLDKLFPILDEFNTQNGVSFADPVNGTDLNITMADTEFNKRVYKTISAISTRGKAPLHTDSIMVRQWLDDSTTWREVFLPKRISNVITAHEYLELCATGDNPYWEDTDANNKHWVFPNHPELEVKANTRRRNLDSDEDDNFEYASDMVNEEPRVSIGNITVNNVGTYPKDSVDITAPANEDVADIENEIPSSDEYDDLPF